jgi:hypothetical protein
MMKTMLSEKRLDFNALEKERRCQVVVEFLLDNSPDVMQPNSVADHKTGSGSVLQY